MALCPKCGQSLDAGAVECAFCGIVLAKWRAAERTPPAELEPGANAFPEAGRASATEPPAIQYPGVPPAPPPSKKLLPWVIALLSALFIVVVVACGGLYWLWKTKPWEKYAQKVVERAVEKVGQELLGRAEEEGPFDLTIPLEGDPLSLAWRPGELVAGNRVDPWGFLRMKVAGPGKFSISEAPVTDAVYGQKIGNPWGLTWNGQHFVAYFAGSWVQKPGYVFTLHHPETLKILSSVAAPAHLGALVWDGQGYWAATRKNTEDAPEPAYLYRLDADFRVTAQYPPPAVGCQGLAWDGEHLWFADVFTDSLFVLEVSGPEPQVLVKKRLPFTYVSGVAFDGERIWVCEYGEKRLRRMSVPLQMAMKQGLAEPPAEEVFEVSQAVPTTGASAEEVAALRAKLRSEDSLERNSATFALERMGLQPDYARDDNAFPSGEDPEAAEMLRLEAEIRDGELYAAWTTHFGADLFSNNTPSAASSGFSMPTFARYTVSVEGEGLPQKIEKEFDAKPGTSRQEWTLMATGLGPGSYRVSVFIFVQFVDKAGGNRILNNSTGSVTVGIP